MKNHNKILILFAGIVFIVGIFAFKVPAQINHISPSFSKSRLLVPPANAQEIVEMRTRNSKTWLMETRPDGSSLLMWQGKIGDMHYKNNPNDPNESWKDINTDIVSSDLKNYDYEMTEAGYKVYLKEKFNSGEIVRYEKNGEWLEIEPGTLSWVSGTKRQLISEPRDVSGFPLPDNPNQIYWANAYGGKLDFQLIVRPTRLVKYLIIENFNHLQPLNQELAGDAENVYLELNLDFKYSENLKMNKTNKNTIEFQNSKGEVLWEFLKPSFWDSGEPQKQGTSGFNIRKNMAHSLTVSVRVPYPWLEEAVFPVYVDPTWNVEASADDVRSNGTTFSINSSDNIAGRLAGGAIQDSAMRFLNMNIPQGSTINSAFITFIASAAGGTGNTVLSNLSLEDVDDALQITSEGDFNGRALTAVIAWDSIGAWTEGVAYDTPSLVTPLQTVINRAGWSNSNAVNVFWKDDGSSLGAMRYGAAWDDTTYTEPRLTIEYWVPKPPGVSPAGGGFLMF